MFTVLVNKYTSRYVVIDNNKVRYERMKNRVVNWAGLTEGVVNLFMITLTYDVFGTLVGKPCTWSPNDIRDFMRVLRRKLGGRLLAYAWVAELTKAGRVHYHVVVRLTEGQQCPYPDKTGMWKMGMSRVERARTPYYLVKYVGKEYQKDYDKMPKGIRTFAVWIREDLLKKKLRYMSLRAWQRDFVDRYGWEFLPDCIKPDGGWYYVASTATERYGTMKAREEVEQLIGFVLDDGDWEGRL